jgi:GDPmannose 4,6-dehydratase
MTSAFITGVTGQDGYYLAKLLLEKDYFVHGTIRRSSNFNTQRIDELISKYGDSGKFSLYYSDLLDSSSITSLINKIKPKEIYNLAAQSHVAVSFQNPQFSINTSTLGATTLLEAVRNLDNDAKFYQASSSEMYGGEEDILLDENSKFSPKSPYAAGKLFAFNMTKLYRESYGIFCTNGILFNHESPLRGETFVTRKITRAVGRIKHGLQTKLTLGNLDAKRDWGFAGDYVEAMWLMLQHNIADDWVISSGESHTVREFAKKAFEVASLDWEEFIITDEKYFRPNEVKYLLGDSSKARRELNWEPKVDFDQLIELMVNKDLKLAESERLLVDKKLLYPTWENPSV